VQVLLKEKAINSFALVEEQLKLQREHAQLQQQYSEASAAVADLQQQAQQALDQQAAAEAAQQEAEKHYNAVLKDKQRTERQLQAAEKKLSTAVKVSALLTQYACDLMCRRMKCIANFALNAKSVTKFAASSASLISMSCLQLACGRAFAGH
jgi:chromosome segregation ATPase